MSLNPKYIPLGYLQDYFVDKQTGFPLAAGIVTFYSDISRITLKPVFELTGSPPDYTYTELPNPLILSNVGTFVDEDGNDIIPYAYPYDEDGNILNYYITVKNSGSTLQFTREGVPNVSATAIEMQGVTNYVPNGQFIAHQDIPADTTHEAGEIRQAVTPIAFGDWTFERPDSSNAKDFVYFDREGQYVTNPTANPRYSLRVVCEQVGTTGNTYKDVRLKFDDVNKFASSTQMYTFSLTAKSNNAVTDNLSFILIKNFGTGGSATAETFIKQITINQTYNIYNIFFMFGENTGKVIGLLDDDYVQLVIRYPLNELFDISVVDILQTFNTVSIAEYPEYSERQQLYQSLTPPLPESDGSSLYLPMILTQNGFIYDDSTVGTVKLFSNQATAPAGYVLAFGERFEASLRSIEGIPYTRIQGKYKKDAGNNQFYMLYGTGSNYFMAIQDSQLNDEFVRIVNNDTGAVIATADGAVPTGFSFNTIHIGADYSSLSYMYVDYGGDYQQAFVIKRLLVGAPPFDSVGTSGFTNIMLQTTNSLTADTATMISVFKTLPATGLAGKYISFYSISSGGTDQYYLWYTVDGAGSDPMGGGTGILVKLRSTDDARTVAIKTSQAISGFNETTIGVTLAASIPPGSYFTVNAAPSENYYIWYTKDGAGVDPAVSGRVGIEVDVLTGETAIQVATKTINAINLKYFAVPDLSNQSLRFAENGVESVTLAGDTMARYVISPQNIEHAFSFQYQTFKTPATYPSQGGPDQIYYDSLASNTYLDTHGDNTSLIPCIKI